MNHYQKSVELFNQKSYDAALAEISAALNADYNGEGIFQRGLIYMEMGRNDDATTAFESAIENDPKNKEKYLPYQEKSIAMKFGTDTFIKNLQARYQGKKWEIYYYHIDDFSVDLKDFLLFLDSLDSTKVDVFAIIPNTGAVRATYLLSTGFTGVNGFAIIVKKKNPAPT